MFSNILQRFRNCGTFFSLYSVDMATSKYTTVRKKGTKAVTGAVPYQKGTLLYLKGAFGTIIVQICTMKVPMHPLGTKVYHEGTNMHSLGTKVYLLKRYN